MYNAVLERIHQVQGNLVRTFNISIQNYVDEDYPWTGILAAAAFEICSKTNRQNFYSPGKLIFGRDIILLIKERVDWELIRQRKHMKINRDKTWDNKHRFEYEYKVGDDTILTNHTAYKYETPYKGPFVITQCFTNDMVNLQYGPTKIRYNIRRINTYKLDTKNEYYNSINMSGDVSIWLTVIYFCIEY